MSQVKYHSKRIDTAGAVVDHEIVESSQDSIPIDYKEPCISKNCKEPERLLYWVQSEACELWLHNICGELDSIKHHDEIFVFLTCFRPAVQIRIEERKNIENVEDELNINCLICGRMIRKAAEDSRERFRTGKE